jgi:hypothetical protein
MAAGISIRRLCPWRVGSLQAGAPNPRRYFRGSKADALSMIERGTEKMRSLRALSSLPDVLGDHVSAPFRFYEKQRGP